MVFAKLYDLPRRERDERVRAALAFMGLEEPADRLVRTYSGGMIRRLEIALAMLHQPQVLFLDEPTVGLDPVARGVVWDHLEQLRRQTEITIFTTTNYLEEAEQLYSRVANMHHGQVAAIGTPDGLKATVGGRGVTLNEVFVHYAGETLETGGTYRDTERTRRTATRLG